MNSNPTTDPVTARIVFTGVMLMCINQEKQYEVGMIQCPLHEPRITITQSKPGTEPQQSDLDWPAGHDLIFKVNNPDTEGVSCHHALGVDTDFGRVIDLEGKDFHDQRVTINKDLLNGRRLGVTAGKVYTHKLSDVEFDLLTWTDENDIGSVKQELGRIADEIGLNIVCRDEPGSGIDILDKVTGRVIKSLPAGDNTYRIEINNDCSRESGPLDPPVPDVEGAPEPAPAIGTDFRFYYDLVSAKDGLKFDLSIRVDEAMPPPSPGACEATFLGETDTLGLNG